MTALGLTLSHASRRDSRVGYRRVLGSGNLNAFLYHRFAHSADDLFGISDGIAGRAYRLLFHSLNVLGSGEHNRASVGYFVFRLSVLKPLVTVRAGVIILCSVLGTSSGLSADKS